MSAPQPLILTIGLESEIETAIADLLHELSRKTALHPIPMQMESILTPLDHPPALIICGPPKGISAIELAQALRMQHQEIPIYLLCSVQEKFERKTFIQNGFTDAFLMSLDTKTFRTELQDTLAKITRGALKAFRPVKIVDVEPGMQLDFDTSIYFPANNKFIKLSNAGDALDAERIDKIKKSRFNSIYVPSEQMPSFYKYSAKRLKELGSGTFSATERRERLHASVRDLMSGLFSEHTSTFEEGQAILKDCGEIVKEYIMQGAEAEWFVRIQQVLGEHGDLYSHSANVSTLAALFSMGLGIGNPEELALAGLLHDIGLGKLPTAMQSIDPEQVSRDQLPIYQKHPEISVTMIKARKIQISDKIAKTILQHHELYNGTGYPNGIFGDHITKEAQILALADRFDYLTRLKEGKPLMTPLQAAEWLRNEQVNNFVKIHYNPEILRNLLTLFPV